MRSPHFTVPFSQPWRSGVSAAVAGVLRPAFVGWRRPDFAFSRRRLGPTQSPSRARSNPFQELAPTVIHSRRGLAFGFVLALTFAASPLPAARADILVGAAKRVITPNPLLPVSGGIGTAASACTTSGAISMTRAIVFRTRRRLRRRRQRRPDRLSPACWRTAFASEVSRDSGQEHPHRLDPHAQRARLLRLPRRQGRAHAATCKYMDFVCDKAAEALNEAIDHLAAVPHQNRHGRGQGQDRLQLLRPAPLRPADERDPGRVGADGQDRRHAGQLRDPSRGARQRSRHSAAPTWSARCATSSKPTRAAWPSS